MNKSEGTTNLIRPIFGPGMLLQHEDLELLGKYPRELSRLLFKSFFGCGVICGLTVNVETDCDNKLKVTVQRGVALTCSGDPIPVSGDLVDCTNVPANETDSLWVILCRGTKRVGQRTTMCDTDGEGSAAICTREVDTYKLEIKPTSDGACKCPETVDPPAGTKDQANHDPLDENRCHESHNDGTCGCDCNDCGDCVVLAKIVYDQEKKEWSWNYSTRRFIRPQLLSAPKPSGEDKPKKAEKTDTGKAKSIPSDTAAKDAYLEGLVKKHFENSREALVELVKNEIRLEIPAQIGRNFAEYPILQQKQQQIEQQQLALQKQAETQHLEHQRLEQVRADLEKQAEKQKELEQRLLEEKSKQQSEDPQGVSGEAAEEAPAGNVAKKAAKPPAKKKKATAVGKKAAKKPAAGRENDPGVASGITDGNDAPPESNEVAAPAETTDQTGT